MFGRVPLPSATDDVQYNYSNFLHSASHSEVDFSDMPSTPYGPLFDSGEHLYEHGVSASSENTVPTYSSNYKCTLPFVKGYAPSSIPSSYSYVFVPHYLNSRCLLNLTIL